MKSPRLADAASPKKLAAYLLKLPKPSRHRHGGKAESVREADYKGHQSASSSLPSPPT